MIFRYCGGKNKKSVQKKILGRAPLFYSEYREPFCGGCGIFWAIDPDIKRWINDLDKYLMCVYRYLKNKPKDFIASCRDIEPAKESEPLTSARPGGKQIYNERLKNIFDTFVEDINGDQALRYFFINRTNWAGRVDYTRPSRLYFSNPSGWNIVKTDALEKAAGLLKDATLTTGDYDLLLSSPGDDVFIYLDPPYFVNSGFDDGSSLYRHNFTIKDHKKLAEKVLACKHKILLSYDDDEDGYIRSLYSDPIFNIYKEEWTYCGTSSAKSQKNNKKKTGKELIITNYKD